MNKIEKTKYIWLGVTVAVMFVLPFVVAKGASECAGMALCMVLFFVINPLYSAIIGFVSGKNLREMWSLPIVSAVAFLAGVWAFLDPGEAWFIAYAAVYLLTGCFTMWIGKRLTAA